jgi:hypothetical protein
MIRINEVFFCELYWNISFFLNNHDIDACFRINAQNFYAKFIFRHLLHLLLLLFYLPIHYMH